MFIRTLLAVAVASSGAFGSLAATAETNVGEAAPPVHKVNEAGSSTQPTASIPITDATAMSGQEREFNDLDADNDGYLNTAETQVKAGLSENPNSDSNNDGRIDRAEFAAFESLQQESDSMINTESQGSDLRGLDTEDVRPENTGIINHRTTDKNQDIGTDNHYESPLPRR